MKVTNKICFLYGMHLVLSNAELYLVSFLFDEDENWLLELFFFLLHAKILLLPIKNVNSDFLCAVTEYARKKISDKTVLLQWLSLQNYITICWHFLSYSILSCFLKLQEIPIAETCRCFSSKYCKVVKQ